MYLLICLYFSCRIQHLNHKCHAEYVIKRFDYFIYMSVIQCVLGLWLDGRHSQEESLVYLAHVLVTRSFSIHW